MTDVATAIIPAEIPGNGNGTDRPKRRLSPESLRERAAKAAQGSDPIIRLSELARELEACDNRKGEIVAEMRQYRPIVESLAKLVGLQVG